MRRTDFECQMARKYWLPFNPLTHHSKVSLFPATNLCVCPAMALCTPNHYAKLDNLSNGRSTISRNSRRKGRRLLSVRMASPEVSSLKSYEEGELERPRWSGETPLSRLVGALISFKPLYSVLKFGARQALIRYLMPHFPCNPAFY